jgi:hypothetical protein
LRINGRIIVGSAGCNRFVGCAGRGNIDTVRIAMRRCIHVVTALTAAAGVLSVVAQAVAAPCPLFASPSVSPAHPGTADVLTFRLPAVVVPDAPGVRMFATSSVDESTATIHLDVLVTIQQRPFFGRQLINDPRLDVFGYVGPLPPGSYTVATSITTNDGATNPNPSVSVCDDSDLPVQDAIVVVGSMAAATTTRPIIEFYNASLDHYFMSQDPDEIRALDSGVKVGWVRTGQSIDGYVPTQSDQRGRPAARYYGLPSAGLDTHFFTIRDENPGMAWVLESTDVFELAQPDTLTGECAVNTTVVPVYRLWNQRLDSNHRYTTDLATQQQMIARGWLAEGYGPNAVMLCAPAS